MTWDDIAQVMYADEDSTDVLTPGDVCVEHKRSGLLLYCIHHGQYRQRLYVGWCRAHAVADFVAEVGGGGYREPRDGDLVTDGHGDCGCW